MNDVNRASPDRTPAHPEYLIAFLMDAGELMIPAALAADGLPFPKGRDGQERADTAIRRMASDKDAVLEAIAPIEDEAIERLIRASEAPPAAIERTLEIGRAHGGIKSFAKAELDGLSTYDVGTSCAIGAGMLVASAALAYTGVGLVAAGFGFVGGTVLVAGTC
ncbi:hypothetical protein [Actinomadura rupiterrae]|uniref:hypothetical protein n=1 Tax=Actinomadura rupiterrae TaxID=559627 RepID=UPI0020A5BDCA|nr:hypothetical protein [Actinomadura rupiterrae]MCP2342807.1 hypothetical protein [Actinomadura rupiterrae]